MTEKHSPLLQPKANKPKRPKKPDPDDGLTQSERFIKAAQELGTDDDPERFAGRVRALASVSPTPHGSTKKAPKRQASK